MVQPCVEQSSSLFVEPRSGFRTVRLYVKSDFPERPIFLQIIDLLNVSSIYSHMDERFRKQKYLIKRQFFKLIGGAFRLYDMNDQLCFYVEQKAFKLKEDIRVYGDEAKSEELLTIHARNIIDFSAIYDVNDSKTGQKLGALRRKGLKSMFVDEWEILDNNDAVIGLIKEDSALMATLRRFLTNLIPQEYYGFIGEKAVWHFKQNFNPFTIHINLDMTLDTNDQMDDRMGIAAAVLLCAVEGRQD